MSNEGSSGIGVSELSDAEVLANTRSLIGRSNQVFAALLAHLGEVETRGLHRTRACSSLYAYCIYELRLSEDAAVRRVSAARLVRRFPAVSEAIANGELHLTGLLMLGPLLTRENHREVLARAKHRTKKEIARLVRELDPLPDVPARIEALGPALGGASVANATWHEQSQARGAVRELRPGDRPRDWVGNGTLEGALEVAREAAGGLSALARVAAIGNGSPEDGRMGAREVAGADGAADGLSALARVAAIGNGSREGDEKECAGEVPVPDDALSAPARVAAIGNGSPEGDEKECAGEVPVPDDALSALARVAVKGDGPLAAGTRFKVQFTAEEEYVVLFERAAALLSHRERGGAIERIHLLAMRALVEKLEKRRFGTPNSEPPSSVPASSPRSEPRSSASRSEPLSRHVPARVRRAVFERDGARCAYVDARGQRCRETRGLEIHHLEPFAWGGEHREGNLALRCSAHNALAAELDFGNAHVASHRDSLRHEPATRAKGGQAELLLRLQRCDFPP